MAWYFRRHHHLLPESFLEPLLAFIKKTKSHVATLNYDNLMYQKMIDAGILKDFTGGCLVDGMLGTGFQEENLKRKFGNEFGYYLHLHGTPLFIEEDGVIKKQSQPTAQEIPTKHLVLSHVRHKRTIIDASPVLSAYWKFFTLALRESTNIFVFGYSGLDKHLNELIANQASGKNIHVIEWSGAGKQIDRKRFWKTELGNDFESLELTLTQMDNILEFTEWAKN